MEYRERKEITSEEAVILWQASRLDLSEDHERAPEILKVHGGSVIGTLGNFSASIGKAKSKKTFNVSAIVAAALKNGTVLQVEKDERDPDISTVKAAHIRAMNFEPFAFRINGEALPELLDEYLFKHKDPGKGKREKFDPYKDITEKQHRIALEAAFTLKDEYGYKELAEELRKTYASVGVMLGENRLTDLITVLKNKRMIVQENGRKYTFKPDFYY